MFQIDLPRRKVNFDKWGTWRYTQYSLRLRQTAPQGPARESTNGNARPELGAAHVLDPSTAYPAVGAHIW